MRWPALRSLFWRLGRKLYCLSRLESVNDPETNGEYWLLAQAIQSADGAASVLFDIGANKGDWTMKAISLLPHSTSAQIHAFEPAQSTFEHASDRLAGNSIVTLHRLALSDRTGEAQLYIVADLAGTNSLHGREGSRSENVPTASLDDFARRDQIEKILLVKSDTEGHDFHVISGAAQALSNGVIDVWQFEYNHRWVSDRHFLKDVFDFIADKPYRLGKLHGKGIELYREWHPELERFFETNYALVRKGCALERLCTIAQFDVSNVAVAAKGRAR